MLASVLSNAGAAQLPSYDPAAHARHDRVVALMINSFLLQAHRNLVRQRRAGTNGTLPRVTVREVLAEAHSDALIARKRSRHPALRDAEHYLWARLSPAEASPGVERAAQLTVGRLLPLLYNAGKAAVGSIAPLERALRSDPNDPTTSAAWSSVEWGTRGNAHAAHDVPTAAGCPRLVDPHTLDLAGSGSETSKDAAGSDLRVPLLP